MKQQLIKYKWLFLYIFLLSIAGIVLLLVVTRPHSIDSPSSLDTTRSHLTDMAESYKTEQSYSKLPEDKRQEFLTQQAGVYAIDPLTQEVTPDTLRAACVEKSSEDINEVIITLRSSKEGADNFKNYIPSFTEAKAAARAHCYANFDPEGKEDVPPMMEHP